MRPSVLSSNERLEDLLPVLHLGNLRDDPSTRQAGWNFLLHRENKEHLPGDAHWLLDRMLDAPALRERFLESREGKV